MSASWSCWPGARALLFPIRWDEPFGMVMLESMACGTPVLAFVEGAVPEVVEDGVTGFLCKDKDDMAKAVGRVGELRREDCRARSRGLLLHETHGGRPPRVGTGSSPAAEVLAAPGLSLALVVKRWTRRITTATTTTRIATLKTKRASNDHGVDEPQHHEDATHHTSCHEHGV